MIKKTSFQNKIQIFFKFKSGSIKVINIEDFNLPLFFLKNKNIFKI